MTPQKLILGTVFLALLLILIACQSPETVGASQKNVAYGPDRQQTFDVCLPSHSAGAPVPALVMIHGGAWRSGDKQDWFENCQRAAAAGVAGIAIDYRLVDGTVEHSWPAQLVDAQLAMRWVRSHAGTYGIDPNRICAIGDSAGGQLAVFLAALNHVEAGEYADQLASTSPQANCAIDWFGPVDLSGLLTQSTMMREMFAGMEPAEYSNAERSASPLYRIGPLTAPMLIVHGADDNLVSVSDSRKLHEALVRNGVPNQLRTFMGGHEFAKAQNLRVTFANAALAFTKDPFGYLRTNPQGSPP